ncbi:response regulator [Stieleria varia]|uniref:Transcriptional regulatory protein WalR n=1 Tax=Stieleria varia TaxID=2528005 RepID=A0A5C5ZLI1_9BACT|nr:response regulator [Stieleria varia]TWT88068.1 Transcriptional regulatory protein WalR [Stieleria varia]
MSAHTSWTPDGIQTTNDPNTQLSEGAIPRRRRILVADDSKTVRRLNERVLKQAGFDVLLAEDGRQAVEIALDQHPDLVVLDINMPELDGYGVCHELLAREDWSKDTPFIFLTCAEAPHLTALGNELGAFLPKPTQADVLLETVISLLTEFRRHRRH